MLGSIYGGITGITEAAGIGSIAVLLLITLRGEFTLRIFQEAAMRTFKSNGTIMWVTIGATAVAGAYTLSGGPTYVANLIPRMDISTLSVLLIMMVVFLSPPFGGAAFYLKSVAPSHITLAQIFRNFLPFIAIQIMASMLFLFAPQITTLFL